MKLVLLSCFYLLLTSCSDPFNHESIQEENDRGIIEFAKVVGASHKVLTEDWGIAAKSKINHPSLNLAFISRKVTPPEFEKILKKVENFFQSQAFTFWIEEKNKDLVPSFEKAGYHHISSFPGLYLRLNREFGGLTPAHISIRQVDSEETMRDWAFVTSTVQQLPYEPLLSFCQETLQKAPHVSFYVAYHQQKPVSSRMMIIFNKTVTGYLSSTLQDYRSRGVASYLLSSVLTGLKKEGIQYFVIQALSNPVVWKKFGLKESGQVYMGFTKAPKK